PKHLPSMSGLGARVSFRANRVYSRSTRYAALRRPAGALAPPGCGIAPAGFEIARREGAAMPAPHVAPKELRRVVIAASVGNIIEWYDFYIFGSLAAILAVKFFQKGHPVAAFLSTVAIFSVGFLIRPLGAFVFGWLGDKVGRK